MSPWTVLVVFEAESRLEHIPLNAEDEWDAFAKAAWHLKNRSDQIALIAAVPGWPDVFPPTEDWSICAVEDYPADD